MLLTAADQDMRGQKVSLEISPYLSPGASGDKFRQVNATFSPSIFRLFHPRNDLGNVTKPVFYPFLAFQFAFTFAALAKKPTFRHFLSEMRSSICKTV